ncbi:MAG: S9 family peptidase [Sphingomonas sp.]|nr:S9 family peptidase [Sphingomonas sp.]
MRGVIVAMIGLGGAALAAQALAADPPKSAAALAEAFGQREYVSQISISPDGSKVALLVAAKERQTALLIYDTVAGGTPKAILASTGKGDQLTSCNWATDVRLICRIYLTTTDGFSRIGYTRVVAINADGSNLKQLTAKTTGEALGFNTNGGGLVDWGGESGMALMTRAYVPEKATGTLVASTKEGLGVDLVDTNTLSRKVVEQPHGAAVSYISDGQGNVRIMGIRPRSNTGYSGDRIIYSYRTADSRDWKPLTTVVAGAQTMTGFVPYAVDRDKNVVYGMENITGRAALYSISLDGKLTKTMVLERPDVDMDDLIRIGRQNRVVGATYITDKREAVFFDPALQSLRLGLAKALPGRKITFVDASADENKLVLFADSDTDPGKFYLFDKKTRALTVILPVRPDLESVQLAIVRAISYQATDGTTIPAYLTLPAGSDGKNLPTIVMPHGGPAYRDEWGFDWLVQFFAARGFAVIQPQFRGSAGYGDVWYQKNGFVSWKTAIGDVNDAGHWAVKSGLADPSKLAIVGWSYGGYAALQTSVLNANLFKAIVAVAPVTDLDALRDESKGYTNYPQVDAFIGHGPWVIEGSPARNAEKIKAPVLLFHGDRDQNVGIGESRLMAGKLKSLGGKVELVEFNGLDHQLADSAARAQLLAKADAFLRASMGMQP